MYMRARVVAQGITVFFMMTSLQVQVSIFCQHQASSPKKSAVHTLLQRNTIDFLNVHSFCTQKKQEKWLRQQAREEMQAAA
jgi:hypothetical protein